MDIITKSIYTTLIYFGLLGIIVGIPLSIFFVIKMRKAPDIILKKKFKKKALWLICGPILLFVIAAIVAFLGGFIRSILFGR